MDGEELVTAEHLFRQYTGQSLAYELAQIASVRDRIAYAVNQIQDFIGIKDFGKYIATLLEIDLFFLNEDRHTNNIALIYNPKTKLYRSSPLFDHGLALLADTINDYAMERPLEDCLKAIKAKPFSMSFEEQADEADSLYGRQVRFSFQIKDVQAELSKLGGIYDDRILERVENVFRNQMRTFRYMFI